MRLGRDGRLEETPEETARRNAARLGHEVESAKPGGTEVVAEGQTGPAPSQEPHAHEATIERLVEAPAPVSSIGGETPHHRSVRSTAGEAATIEAADDLARRVGLARQRLTTWALTLGSLAIIACALLGIYLANARRPTIWFLASMAALGVGTLAVIAVIVVTARALRRFADYGQYLLRSTTLDTAMSKALQYGDPRGDGRTGWYLTYSQVLARLEKPGEDESSPPRPPREKLLVGATSLPPECRPSTLRHMATEEAINRWLRLGLLSESPLLVGEEVRFVFVGKRLRR
jgi:hypothetical protein